MKLTLLFLPLLLQSVSATEQEPLSASSSHKPRVAIIGAGAGGSSAAYHLQKFTSHGFDIEIFDKNRYIGGRSTTIGNYDQVRFNKGDDDIEGVNIELGASVFVGANKILQGAVKEFNLTLIKKDLHELYPDKFKGSYGVWDGKEFVFSGDSNDSYLKIGWKLISRYRFAPFRTYSLVKRIVKTFIDEYYENEFPFYNLTKITHESGLVDVTNINGEDYLTSQKISSAFLNELIQPATRVNYRSNLNDIHGLESVVSLAADDGTVSVKGGNYQIFEKFIEYSNATLQLDTKITKLQRLENGKWNVGRVLNEEGELFFDQFDHVIIASPFYQSDLEIDNLENGIDEIKPVKNVEYRDLFVTYIRTKRTNPIKNSYFGEDVKELPETILTTVSNSHGEDVGVPFFSVSIVNYDNSTDTIIYKVFSPRLITYDYLKGFLFQKFNGVTIFYSKLWKPYPHLLPTDQFDDFNIGPNLWYLNTIEEFISTMETSALAGANVAGLISTGKNTTAIAL